MNTIHLDLPAEIFSVLARRAAVAGQTPAVFLAEELSRKDDFDFDPHELPDMPPDPRLRALFGKSGSNEPLDLDNQRIDADLAAEYARTGNE